MTTHCQVLRRRSAAAAVNPSLQPLSEFYARNVSTAENHLLAVLSVSLRFRSATTSAVNTRLQQPFPSAITTPAEQQTASVATVAAQLLRI